MQLNILYWAEHALSIGYSGKYAEESVHKKFMGFKIDNRLNWTNCIDKLIPR
jgi:hypothetical protein